MNLYWQILLSKDQYIFIISTRAGVSWLHLLFVYLETSVFRVIRKE